MLVSAANEDKHKEEEKKNLTAEEEQWIKEDPMTWFVMPQMRRASEILYKAHREGVRQIKGDFKDSKGGYCALGLLSDYGKIIRVGVTLLNCEYTNRYNTSVEHDNDVENLSFKEIGDRFAKLGY
jgi:hypothetical protein